MPSPPRDQQEEERIEALVAARLEQRLTVQLRDVGKVLLLSQRAGCSVLETAASMGRHALLREILNAFAGDTAPPDIRSDLRAATLAAASQAQPQCLQLLLDSCTSPSALTELLEAKDSNKNTPLMLTAAKGHVECMRLLLEHSPETQLLAKDSFGRNALLQTAFSGHAPCMQLLLAHSPDVQVASTDHKGGNALMFAAALGHTACVQLLLAHSPGAQVAAVSSSGLNALMSAAGSGHTACMQLLLAHSPGLQLAALSGKGRSALGFAASNAHADCLKLLLSLGPSQQQLDKALQASAQKISQLQALPSDAQRRPGLKKCIELLLANGAMPIAQAPEGAIAAIRSINRGLTARALVPDMANEAVLGLALAAAGSKRQGGGEESAAHPSQRTRSSH